MMNCPDCGKQNPNNATICSGWLCGYKFVIQDFAEETRSFSLLYAEVTESLEDYVDHPLNPDKLNFNEKAWFKYLIESFHAYYQEWGKNKEPRFIRYLNHFRGWLTPTVLKLVGHVYLHIAYDMPRVIAESLSNDQHPYMYQDPLGREVPVMYNRVRPRGIYQKQSPVFLELAERSFRKYKITGPIGFLSKIVPKRLSLFRVLGNWIVGLRMTAWVHGEILRDSPKRQRQQLESNLLYAVNQAAEDVVGHRWNPLWWPSRLQPPELLLVVLALQGGLANSSVWNRYFLIWLLLALTVAYLSFLYFGLVRYVDYLGEAIYRRTAEAMLGSASENLQ